MPDIEEILMTEPVCPRVGAVFASEENVDVVAAAERRGRKPTVVKKCLVVTLSIQGSKNSTQSGRTRSHLFYIHSPSSARSHSTVQSSTP